jgi:tetratricopeptide (TPR) repeat protein/predicted Ser/Thr protein kinase
MIGRTISHYKILEELGRGGMGVVYKAEDLNLGRVVAIKFLPPHLSKDEESISRFIHEAKAASALDHTNIGTLYEVDRTPEGETFIVMAYYKGETLRERIDRGGMRTEESLDIASQIASGLARAHEKGIVHRDIKPSNIIITKDKAAKIIDFGLAKLAGKTRLTKEGSTLGTAAYMSPEQARGEEVDHRSDIFSLGSILYEMLAGEPPFKGEHEAALLYCIVHEERKPLSELKVEIQESLHAIVDKTLSKEPAKRYQSASELKDDLDSLKESSGSATRPVRVKWKRSPARRWIMAAAGIVIIAAVAALVLRGRLGIGTVQAEEPALAVIGFRDLTDSEDSMLATGLMSLLNTGLIDNCPIRVVSDEMIQYNRRKVFGESTAPVEVHQIIEIARKSKATYFISGEVNEFEGKQFAVWRLVETRTGDNLTGGTAGGDDIFSIADEIIESAIDKLAERTGLPKESEAKSVTEVTTEIPEAYEKYIAGMTAWDNHAHREAIEHLEMAVGLDSTFALAYLALSKINFDLGTRGGPVNDYWDKAWAYRYRVSLKDRERLRVWGDYISWTYGIDDIAKAYEDMLEQWPDEISVYREISSFLFREWYSIRGVQFVERGLEYYPDDVILRHYLAVGLALTGETERALKEQKLTVLLHPANENQWDYLGLMYLAEAFPDSAEWAFGKALEIDGSFLPSQFGLGYSAYCRGDIDRAIEILKGILADAELMSVERRTVLADMRQSPGLAAMYAEAGRYGDASDAFEEARVYASSLNDTIRLERERSFFLLRVDRADELLKVSRRLLDSSEGGSGDLYYAYENGLQLRMMALVALDSLDAAKETIEQLRGIVERAGGYTVVLIDLHESQIDIKTGKADAALARLDERRRRGINVGGMLDIYFREICSRAHEAAGDLEMAAEVHKALLRIYGGHALSHYELGRLYEEMGRPDEARGHYEKFLEMWRNADEGLPQPECARARLAALKGRG